MSGGALRAILPTQLDFPEAPCIENPEMFFPKGNPITVERMGEAAKAVCAGCQYRNPCAEWALKNREPEGVWGGTSASDRARLLDQTA